MIHRPNLALLRWAQYNHMYYFLNFLVCFNKLPFVYILMSKNSLVLLITPLTKTAMNCFEDFFIQREVEGDTETSCMCCFTPQVAATASAGPGYCQDTECNRPTHTGLALLLPSALAESDRNEQLCLQQAPKRNAGIADRGLSLEPRIFYQSKISSLLEIICSQTGSSVFSTGLQLLFPQSFS